VRVIVVISIGGCTRRKIGGVDDFSAKIAGLYNS
jgi:hypothetical protein